MIKPGSAKILLGLLTGAFLFAFVLIIVFAGRGSMPALIASLYAFPHGDKAGHFLLMGVLSFVVNLNIAFWKTRFEWRDFLPGSLIVTALVSIEEFAQLFIRSRSFSLVDLSFSWLGIWLFGYLAARLGGSQLWRAGSAHHRRG